MPVSLKQLRGGKWQQIYSYRNAKAGFDIFAVESVLGLTMTHEFRPGKKTLITYTVCLRRGKPRRTTDSPAQAVRYYNDEERQARLDAARAMGVIA